MTLALRLHLFLVFGWVSTIGLLLYYLQPIVAPASFQLAAAIAAALPLLWLTMLAWRHSQLRHRPETREFAAQFNLVAMWMQNVATVALGWILLPQVDATWQPVAVFYVLGTISIEFIATVRPPPATGRGSFAPVFLLLATVLYLIVHGGRAVIAMVVYLLAFGYAMLVLRRILQRQANHLHRALEQLARQRDIQTRFLASASHDLGQPLQAARLFFDQAMRSPNEAQRENAVRGVHRAFDNTEGLLTQMLEHLRLQSGRVEARLDEVAIGTLIARLAEMHEPAARAAGVMIIALPTRLCVLADPRLLERAMGNLVVNAIKHGKAARVLVGARRRQGSVRLWVIDDGVGIPDAEVAQLFEDYAQGRDHGDDSHGGFGLGLASARRMMELMGGRVGFDRRWRRGSAFWLELPRAPRPPASALPGSAPPGFA